MIDSQTGYSKEKEKEEEKKKEDRNSRKF